MKSYSGDTSMQYKYVEIEKRTLQSSDLRAGVLSLSPGLYQFKHNSVTGKPTSGYYGKSKVFEVKPSEEVIKVKILVTPAI